MTNWREVLAWQIQPEEPVTVAFAQQHTFVEKFYTKVTYNSINELYNVELGNKRGFLMNTVYYVKENARERWRTYLSQYEMGVEINNWDENYGNV